jgi:hypothetical protein
VGHFSFLLVLALASHWLEDCANCTPTSEENDKCSANLYAIQEASQSTFINEHFTPLVISGNDKNKKVT